MSHSERNYPPMENTRNDGEPTNLIKLLQLIQEGTKNPEQHRKNCKPHFPQSQNYTTVRKRLGTNGIKEKKHCSPKRTQTLVSHLKKTSWWFLKMLGEILCGLMRLKFNFLEVLTPVKSEVKLKAFQKRNIIITVEHGGSSVMVWGFCAASGPGWLTVIDGTVNSALCLKENVRLLVCAMKLKHTWLMQQDNDKKHTSKLSKDSN